MALSAVLVAAMALSAHAVYNDAEYALWLYEEPSWNRDNWEAGKVYYVTWAKLHLCISFDSGLSSLDELREFLQDSYSPTGDQNTMWDLVQRKTIVTPVEKYAIVDDVFWPYHREKLEEAAPVCVADDSQCCCKGRATWGLYIRFDSRHDAFQLLQDLKEKIVEADETICIGMADGGVRKEGIDAQGHMLRVPIDNESKGDAGKIVGIIFGVLLFIGLVVLGWYLWRNREKYFGKWLHKERLEDENQEVEVEGQERFVAEFADPFNFSGTSSRIAGQSDGVEVVHSNPLANSRNNTPTH
eukprot:CAMPEP_0117680970 /NCGR_PEP_ID=MMETSP0804-20121206/18680_1 /TAXON_ID=1074897 /ORGANISM="Tetraselmis astigmatica, Strain CCMP880" /LENGTH=298 /DNA_ID=CAMNT_0005490591 /DNA_START=241 /DNA_END=1137 /DNA_ORIENTATION=-